jgi:beta-lysine 5,6-aminomutase beta subunit
MDLNLREIRPYGDSLSDGAVQMSFTLPLPTGPLAKEAALRLARKMGLAEADVVHMADLGESFTFFVVYGKTRLFIDATEITVTTVKSDVWDRTTCDEKIREAFGRKLKIVGACIGEDAHTVGIDAIMNMKGYAGHYGLERFAMIDAFNLGAQVEPETLLARAREKEADAILVSQVVTQRDAHLQNLTRFVELTEAAGLRDRFVLIAGGPRLDHKMALELGFDAGFGRGTFAEHVASFVIHHLVQKRSRAGSEG